jgi:L-ascorbate metabolism protein UlaG (beta-lactamase superfamily)
MAGPSVLAEQARLWIRYSTSGLVNAVGPFIDRVASALAQSRDLEVSVLKAVEAFSDAASYFVIQPGSIAETFELKNEYLFTQCIIEGLSAYIGDLRYDLDLTGSSDELRLLQRTLELSASGTFTKHAIRKRLDTDGRELFDAFVECGVVVESDRSLPAFAPQGLPGVYRLQHASLLYRTEKTGILVDPHLHSSYRDPHISDIHRDHLQGKVDAILISHFHEDHWFLSTLLTFPLDTLIVVPKVAQPTIICGDMQRILQDIGFRNVIVREWYGDPILVGDVEIHVLPFFGEQPLRYEPAKHPDIRNWGNTYIVSTKQYISWFLIDSGSDVRGSMIEVAEYVRRTFQRIDIVLSNLRPFHVNGPRYINNGLNWLTLGASQICNLKSMISHCITLAPSGVAEVCKTVNARFYLPYAHWWGNVGSTGVIGEGGLSEEALIVILENHLRRIGAGTKIVPWHIGDGFVRQVGGDLTRLPLR